LIRPKPKLISLSKVYKMKKRNVIIVGGGSGSRMGAEIPKQFLLLNGLPVILHSIGRFLEYSPEINLIIVLPAANFSNWEEMCKKFNFSKEHILVEGGATRFDSVKKGLKAIGEDSLVAIHDAVRPLVSIETIESCFSEAEKFGSCIPVMPVKESLRRRDSCGKTISVKRENYFTVQTPQVFDYYLLKKAYNSEYRNYFTDDASVVEESGLKINHIEGNSENIKITMPEDLVLAEILIKQKSLL
jgi:2-C-methyl-D-erythritol 4-phosphate cytidylyltransferase